jgi:hypothetical protein
MTHLLCQIEYLLGMNKEKQYSLVEVSCNKWLEKESDLDDDKNELPILKYDANEDALVEYKEETPMDEEEVPKIPL